MPSEHPTPAEREEKPVLGLYVPSQDMQEEEKGKAIVLLKDPNVVAFQVRGIAAQLHQATSIDTLSTHHGQHRKLWRESNTLQGMLEMYVQQLLHTKDTRATSLLQALNTTFTNPAEEQRYRNVLAWQEALGKEQKAFMRVCIHRQALTERIEEILSSVGN